MSDSLLQLPMPAQACWALAEYQETTLYNCLSIHLILAGLRILRHFFDLIGRIPLISRGRKTQQRLLRAPAGPPIKY